MTGPADLEEMRRRYLADQVLTAIPGQRLVMLFDRLLEDLRRTEGGFERGGIEEIHGNLVHAQEIVLALRGPLTESDWDGAEQLSALYLFVYHRLVQCNMNKDRSLLPACSEIISKLREANRRAVEERSAVTATSDAG